MCLLTPTTVVAEGLLAAPAHGQGSSWDCPVLARGAAGTVLCERHAQPPGASAVKGPAGVQVSPKARWGCVSARAWWQEGPPAWGRAWVRAPGPHRGGHPDPHTLNSGCSQPGPGTCGALRKTSRAHCDWHPQKETPHPPGWAAALGELGQTWDLQGMRSDLQTGGLETEGLWPPSKEPSSFQHHIQRRRGPGRQGGQHGSPRGRIPSHQNQRPVDLGSDATPRPPAV